MIELKYEASSLKYIRNMPRLLHSGIAHGLRQAMFHAEDESKQIFLESGPVRKPPGPLVARTGHLRRSIKSGLDKRNLIGWIGTNVVYGKTHEETGVGRRKALRPFLRPAIEDNMEEISEIIINSVLKEFK